MSNRAVIATQSAPQAIGPYSQGIKAGNTVWISGQIPLEPISMTLVKGDIAAQAEQVFTNLTTIAEAAGGAEEEFYRLVHRPCACRNHLPHAHAHVRTFCHA